MVINVRQEYFQSAEFEQLLKLNKLDSFHAIWSLDTEWFEPPNYRRDGWSGVIKQPLKDESGNTIWVFIKRQENHNFKTLLNPIDGVPTFRREFDNIQALSKKNIPTLSAAYYGERKPKDKMQSILITHSLEGYQSMDLYCLDDPDQTERTEVMRLAGVLMRQLHDAHFRHNCLFPKHIFIKIEGDKFDLKLIDLEKLKWLPLYTQIRENELSRIIRRGQPLLLADIKTWFKSYYTSGKNLQNSALEKKMEALLAAQERYH